MSAVEINTLTPSEVDAILRMRAEKAARDSALAFRSKVLATAHAFDKWSNETGEGLTFSTFVNTFGYQDDDGKKMYDAVQRIYEAITI